VIIATLGIVLQGGNVLLGEKKKGEIGTGVLAGPGGKLDPGESIHECLIRETREEFNIELDPDSLELAAIINFYGAGELNFIVYVYRAKILSGEPEETAEMIPEWHPLDFLPYERMFDSDRHWFLKAACGGRFRANVYYAERAKGFLNIEFSPITA
jgi:8-oxo-dGTP diphosphatase